MTRNEKVFSTSFFIQPSISKRSGFTLVELMTVVVIIGILSIVAIPAYKAYVNDAKLAEGYVYMDTLKKLNVTYFAENNRFFFAGASGDVITEITAGRRVVLADHSWSMVSTPIVDGNPGVQEVFDTFSPAHEPINFGIEVQYGGLWGTTTAGSTPLYAVMSEGTTEGTACTANTANGMAMASTYNVENTNDTDHHWFSIILVANFSGVAKTDCIMMVQTGQTTDEGVSINPIAMLK
jgi:prepilin-type N-terminal cleavage/methylation domain-containing protein